MALVKADILGDRQVVEHEREGGMPYLPWAEMQTGREKSIFNRFLKCI